MNLTVPIREISRLVHARRVSIDPLFRGELLRLFDNPRARMAYFSKHGLSVDDLGEAIWDAGMCVARPSPAEVLELLEQLFMPGVVRQAFGRSEVKAELSELQDEIQRELDVRRGNRWRSFECACFKSAKIRATKDELPPGMAEARCSQCGEPWTLRTIKLDLSNRQVPMTAEEIY